jgi:hypothetical protein
VDGIVNAAVFVSAPEGWAELTVPVNVKVNTPLGLSPVAITAARLLPVPNDGQVAPPAAEHVHEPESALGGESVTVNVPGNAA